MYIDFIELIHQNTGMTRIMEHFYLIVHSGLFISINLLNIHQTISIKCIGYTTDMHNSN